MTRRIFARWTCNSCGIERDTPSDEQPVGWVGYGFTETGVPAGEQRSIGHLCEECYGKVEAALEARESTRIRTKRGGRL
jgi:hypothetical protein